MRRSRFPSAWTTPVSKLTPQQSYRWIVIPIGGLCIVVGVVFVILFGFFNLRPNRPAPFIHSDEGSRVFFCLMGVYLLVMGTGLVKRFRVAWYVFFAYLILGMIYGIAGTAFDPHQHDPPWVYLLVVGMPVNSALAYAFYTTTKSVFRAGGQR